MKRSKAFKLRTKMLITGIPSVFWIFMFICFFIMPKIIGNEDSFGQLFFKVILFYISPIGIICVIMFIFFTIQYFMMDKSDNE